MHFLFKPDKEKRFKFSILAHSHYVFFKRISFCFIASAKDLSNPPSQGQIMTAKNKLLLYSLFLSILILLYAPKGKADELTLATLSTDVTPDTYALVVDVDAETDVLKSFFIDSFSEGKRFNRDALTIDAFAREGIKVKNNLARIETENFLPDQGGMITIDAVYNILTGKRKSYELHLARDKTNWHLFSHGKIISKIHAISNKVPIVGVVGAKDLVMQ